MRILLTNDDGIQARGLHVMRRRLEEIPGADVTTIAPDSNRSGVARGITFQKGLWVDEHDLGDGRLAYSTTGTPVDCVRFAALGLIGEPPQLVVSGINHGANLGDDVTYSGTVAAAFEGVMLGIPAVAVSQTLGGAWGDGEHEQSTHPDFTVAADFTARLVGLIAGGMLPSGSLYNVNAPDASKDGPPGVEVTRLGKRIYREELRLEHRESGRARYKMHAERPSFVDEEGTDLVAVAEGRISITPLRFRLTDHEGVELLRQVDLAGLVAER